MDDKWHGTDAGYKYYKCRCETCRASNTARCNAYYNSPEGRKKVLGRRAKRSEAIASLKRIPCTDCGNLYADEAMQFDHVRGEKKFNLSQADTRSFKSVLEEIEKCEVVCSNCHAVRTRKRRSAT